MVVPLGRVVARVVPVAVLLDSATDVTTPSPVVFTTFTLDVASGDELNVTVRPLADVLDTSLPRPSG